MWRIEGLDWFYNVLYPFLDSIFGSTISSLIVFLLFLGFLAIVGGAISFVIKIIKDIF